MKGILDEYGNRTKETSIKHMIEKQPNFTEELMLLQQYIAKPGAKKTRHQ